MDAGRWILCLNCSVVLGLGICLSVLLFHVIRSRFRRRSRFLKISKQILHRQFTFKSINSNTRKSNNLFFLWRWWRRILHRLRSKLINQNISRRPLKFTNNRILLHNSSRRRRINNRLHLHKTSIRSRSRISRGPRPWLLLRSRRHTRTRNIPFSFLLNKLNNIKWSTFFFLSFLHC